MLRSERFHFLEVYFMDIAEKRWRREREEFMHPRYTRTKKKKISFGDSQMEANGISVKKSIDRGSL